MQADEVEVFELFGGGLPVPHRTVTARAKGMGDRSHKSYGSMLFLNGTYKFINRYFMSVRRRRGSSASERRSMDIHENGSSYL